jgi:hypothetical protein
MLKTRKYILKYKGGNLIGKKIYGNKSEKST